MWNKTIIKPAGETVLNVKNLKTNTILQVSFFVVNNNLNCLLGLQTAKEMDLITVNAESFMANAVECVHFMMIKAVHHQLLIPILNRKFCHIKK